MLIFLFLIITSVASDTQSDTCEIRGLQQTTFNYKQKFKIDNKDSAPNYIIRFKKYEKSDVLKEILIKTLGPQEENNWKWIDRQNKAILHPTDFGLISLGKFTIDIIKEKIQKCNLIKDIFLDRKIVRDLKFEEDETGPKHGWIDDEGKIQKKPGRFQTRWSFESKEENSNELRKLLRMTPQTSLTQTLHAEKIWNLGYTGEGIRVGVFDTGIKETHPHIRKIKERTNWTFENTLEDKLGHGSFVAGVIASSYHGCLGLAPDVDLYTFKVFTNDQVSYTSWFLDAFNYAIISKMHIVNLSIGGPDYLDHPFVEKVLEVTSSGIIMVSAIGNDGPKWGTLNNPADQNDVIGIGGITYSDNVSSFSSRGMTLWELPTGYGRTKPDVMAYASNVRGSQITNGCKNLSGTSVASPVATGSLCLLASTVPLDKRPQVLNPAAMKQALIEGAVLVSPDISAFEQGAGKLDLSNSMEILKNYKPRASAFPAELDLTSPYLWPFSKQPLYANAMPVMLNVTILNGMGVTSTFTSRPEFEAKNELADYIHIDYEYSEVLWPWSGYLALYITVDPKANVLHGIAEGMIKFEIRSPPNFGDNVVHYSSIEIPFKAEIIETPERERRILWDQFHSVKYPPAYFPRDNLNYKHDLLEWHGDHLHTNFRHLYDRLIDDGYFLEILASPFTCFNALQYGSLMIVDSEDEFYSEEIFKLSNDIRNHGLGLIIFSEWYKLDHFENLVFFDDNTRNWWKPVTGGSNVPALNELLESFEIALGNDITDGEMVILRHKIKIESGGHIIKFPENGYLHTFPLKDGADSKDLTLRDKAILGALEVESGRISIFTDADCLEEANGQYGSCYDILAGMLLFTSKIEEKSEIREWLTLDQYKLDYDYIETETMPVRPDDVNFKDISFVLSQPSQCYKNSKAFFIPDDVDTVEQSNETVEQNMPPDEIRLESRYVNTISVNTTDASEQRIWNINYISSQDLPSFPVSWIKWLAVIGVIAVFILFQNIRRKRRNQG